MVRVGEVFTMHWYPRLQPLLALPSHCKYDPLPHVGVVYTGHVFVAPVTVKDIEQLYDEVHPLTSLFACHPEAHNDAGGRATGHDDTEKSTHV